MSFTPTETSKESCQWLIVFAQETGQLVHITEDISIANQIEGLHLLCAIISQKPEALTQANAAAWCYSETGFKPLETSQKPAGFVCLFEYNRLALEKLLIDKVDALRKTVVAIRANESTTRRLWESERKLIDSGATSRISLHLHLNSAASQNKTVAETIEIDKAAQSRAMALFFLTEKTREDLLNEIRRADAKQLYKLRERIVDEVPSITLPEIAPHVIANYCLQEDVQLRVEKERLRLALKQKINQIRLPYLSEFIGNDIAQKTLLLAAHNYKASGISAHKLDIKALITYAAARSISIAHAAAQIMERNDELRSVLFDTEQLKDSTHAKIERAISLSQLTDLANDISKYQFSVKKTGFSAAAELKRKQTERQDISAEQIRYLISDSKELHIDVSTIQRFDTLSSKEFLEAAQLGRPFFITKFVKHWPVYALGFQWLKENFGSLPVKARVNDYVTNAFSKHREHINLDLQEYTALIEKQKSTASSLPPYLGNQIIPEISALCDWPEFFEDWANTKTWIGPAGTITPLHCDYNDNLFAQISGSKSFVLYPPHAAKGLKLKEVNPVLFASKFDPQTPDFSEYPDMQNVQPIKCTVNEGDLLYLPAGWFHHVTAQSFSFSINRWSRDVPNAFKRDMAASKYPPPVLKTKEKAWKK
jgi:hypothetical protein